MDLGHASSEAQQFISLEPEYLDALMRDTDFGLPHTISRVWWRCDREVLMSCQLARSLDTAQAREGCMLCIVSELGIICQQQNIRTTRQVIERVTYLLFSALGPDSLVPGLW
jgi:hypothetical protein